MEKGGRLREKGSLKPECLLTCPTIVTLSSWSSYVDFVVGFGGEVTESTVTSVCYETEGKEGRKQRVIVTKVK